jgi:hypothetical protein
MMKGIGKIKRKKKSVSEYRDTRVSGNPNTRKNLLHFKPDALISRFPAEGLSS